MSLKVAILTFNTNGQIFCCDCYEKKVCGKGRKALDKVAGECVTTDFVSKYIAHMKDINGGVLPDIFIINLQQSAIKNPVSDQLLSSFRDCIGRYDEDYELVGKAKLGEAKIRSLRTGIIMNTRDLGAKFKFHLYRSSLINNIEALTGTGFGKGAIMLDMAVDKGGKQYDFQVINLYLPYSKTADEEIAAKRGEKIDKIREKFRSATGDRRAVPPFIVGGFNYGMNFGLDRGGVKKLYLQALADNELIKPALLAKHGRLGEGEVNPLAQYMGADQLRPLFGNRLNHMVEGVNGVGPLFMPTCKLAVNCKNEPPRRPYNYITDSGEFIPSWCDRILHHVSFQCDAYESFDTDTTCNSDHTPVIGLYTLNPSRAKYRPPSTNNQIKASNGNNQQANS